MYSGNHSKQRQWHSILFLFVSFASVHFQNQSELLIGERRSCMICWCIFTWIKRSICRVWNEISLSESAIETINIWSLFLVVFGMQREWDRHVVFFFFLFSSALQCLLLFTFISFAKFIFVTHSLTLTHARSRSRSHSALVCLFS